MKKIMFKVVRRDKEGRLWSTYDGKKEYTIGKIYYQKVLPDHKSGYYFYPDINSAYSYAKPIKLSNGSDNVITECEVWGKFIDYGGKVAASWFKIIKFAKLPLKLYLEDSGLELPKNIIVDESWLCEHLTKYPNGILPPMACEVSCGNWKFKFDNIPNVKTGDIRKVLKEVTALV